MRTLAAASLSVSLLLVPPGCGSSKSAATPPPADAGSSDAQTQDADSQAAAAYPASHPPLPRIESAGGPVMTAPKIVAITFSGDTLAPSIDDFVAKLVGATDYWAGTSAEYGVGPLTGMTAVTVAGMPAASLADADVQSWLTQQIAGATDAGGDGGAALPATDDDTIYAIFYPDGITVSVNGAVSCQDFVGYHSDFVLPNAAHVAYTVIPRCAPTDASLSAIDAVAHVASHHIIEVAVDPQARDNPAWAAIDQGYEGWAYIVGGGEIGDLCASFPGVFYTPSDLPYSVQRMWSNKAAAASHDPCVPHGASPYFNTAAVLPDVVAVNDPSEPMFTTDGVKIPVGGSATIALQLYSDGPTSGPMHVQALDVASQFYGEAAELSLSLDKTTGVNGDTIHLTVKVLKAGTGGVEPFWIQTQVGQVQTVWLGMVGT